MQDGVQMKQPGWAIDVMPDREGGDWFRQLPASRGVYAFLDEGGVCLCLATTASVRRMVRSRLEARLEDEGRARRIEYGRLTKRVLAMPAGSRLEADWAYLQHARAMLPGTYKTLFDRWNAWFIVCDERSTHPRWGKIRLPHVEVNVLSGRHFGPIGDKHAAQRYIEMLEDAFDLCRYHHILVQAPGGAACAYKEMGRCPAPCDGTVSMDLYREQVAASTEVPAQGFERWSAAAEQAMQHASRAMEFEQAQRLRERLRRADAASKAEFAHVRPLESQRWLVLHQGVEAGMLRVLGIAGGNMEHLMDVPIEGGQHVLSEHLELAKSKALALHSDLSLTGIENLAMVCHRVTHRRHARGSGPTERFVAIDGRGDQGGLLEAARAAIRYASRAGDPKEEIAPSDEEREMELEAE